MVSKFSIFHLNSMQLFYFHIPFVNQFSNYIYLFPKFQFLSTGFAVRSFWL
jgi:hypothetical protein